MRPVEVEVMPRADRKGRVASDRYAHDRIIPANELNEAREYIQPVLIMNGAISKERLSGRGVHVGCLSPQFHSDLLHSV